MDKDIFEETRNQHHQPLWNTSYEEEGPPASNNSDTISADSPSATQDTVEELQNHTQQFNFIENPKVFSTSEEDSHMRSADSPAANPGNGKYIIMMTKYRKYIYLKHIRFEMFSYVLQPHLPLLFLRTLFALAPAQLKHFL